MKALIPMILLAVLLGAAQDKASAPPKLDEKVLNNILILEKQELQLQIQYRNVDDALKAKMASALKDSGIDESKWKLDGNTLEVLPVEPPAAPSVK